jgi:hypothetical protein
MFSAEYRAREGSEYIGKEKEVLEMKERMAQGGAGVRMEMEMLCEARTALSIRSRSTK